MTNPYGPLNEPNTWTAIQIFEAGIRGALLGNSSTVIDATGQAGADMSEKIISAIAALPANGGVVDARGFSSPQTISKTIDIPKGVSLLLPSAIIQSTVMPAFIVNGAGKLIGQGGSLDWPGTYSPIGTVIWVNQATPTSNALITHGPYCFGEEIAGFAIANSTSSALTSYQTNGYGIFLTNGFSSNHIHDLHIVGFSTGFYGEYSYYNLVERIMAQGFGVAGYSFGLAWQSNSMLELDTNFAGSGASGYLIAGGRWNLLSGINAENYPNNATIIHFTGGIQWTIEGKAYFEGNGSATVLNDSSYLAGGGQNNVTLNGMVYEANGRTGLGAGLNGNGVPFVQPVAQYTISKTAPATLSATDIYTEPFSGHNAMFMATAFIVVNNTGGGTVTVHVTYPDVIGGNPDVIAMTQDLGVSGGTNTASGFMFSSGRNIQVSTTGGTTGTYTIYVTVSVIAGF